MPIISSYLSRVRQVRVTLPGGNQKSHLPASDAFQKASTDSTDGGSEPLDLAPPLGRSKTIRFWKDACELFSDTKIDRDRPGVAPAL